MYQRLHEFTQRATRVNNHAKEKCLGTDAVGREAIEGLRFLASLPRPTEKTQRKRRGWNNPKSNPKILKQSNPHLYKSNLQSNPAY